METMKTNQSNGSMWVVVFIFSIVIIFESIAELETFSRNGKAGLLMNTAKYAVKPVNSLAGTPGITTLRNSDLDFPPEPDSLADDNRLYADSVIRFDK